MAYVSFDDRHKQIVEAAIVVISKEGVAGATTRKIADQAGCALAALHYCFRTKDNVFEAVYSGAMDEILDVIDGSVKPGCGVRDAVHTLMIVMLDWYLAHPDVTAAVNALNCFPWKDPETSLARRSYARYETSVRTMLARARADDANSSLDDQQARLIDYALDGILLRFLVTGDETVARLDATAFVGMIGQFEGTAVSVM